MSDIHRVRAGIGLLILVIVAAVLIPSINGQSVAGTAQAVEFPPPPRVGDCVRPPFPVDAIKRGRLPEIPVTALNFGPCTEAKVGEVVDLSDAETITTATPSSPSKGLCDLKIAAYAGLQVSPGSISLPNQEQPGPLSWVPTIGSQAFLIVPSQPEQSAGQTWVACLAATTTRSTYVGSPRNAYGSGNLPDQFGLCWADTDLDLTPDLLPCDGPHRAELLATGWIVNRSLMSEPELDAACLEIAASIMKTPDPTRGGDITVVLDPVRLDGASTPADPMAVNCMVTPSAAGATFTGTVIGLGDRPAPLTN